MNQLVGILSDILNEPFGNKKIYYTDNGYILEDGTPLPPNVFISLQERGLIILSADQNLLDNGSEKTLNNLIPDKVDLTNSNSPIYPIGEILCRVSPTADYKFAGELLYQCSIDDYLISESGYLIDGKTAQILSAQGLLIKNELIYANILSLRPLPQKKKKKVSVSVILRRRIIPLIIIFLAIIGILLFGIPFIQKDLQKGDVSESIKYIIGGSSAEAEINKDFMPLAPQK